MQEKEMKFIELTLYTIDIKIFVNVEMIGHFYRAETNNKQHAYTDICLLTNNNGGMKVKESTYKILELIKQTNKN
jgi:hypothetical protein